MTIEISKLKCYVDEHRKKIDRAKSRVVELEMDLSVAEMALELALNKQEENNEED